MAEVLLSGTYHWAQDQTDRLPSSRQHQNLWMVVVVFEGSETYPERARGEGVAFPAEAVPALMQEACRE